jgi:hypothetical protein
MFAVAIASAIFSADSVGKRIDRGFVESLGHDATGVMRWR